MVRRPAAALGRDRHRRAVLAAQAMGADLAYIGSAFIATREARAIEDYKQAIVDGDAADIVGSSLFTGIFGNYLRPSIVKAGLDPDNLPEGDAKTMNFASRGSSEAKVWRDIWGSGQGIGAVKAVAAGRRPRRAACSANTRRRRRASAPETADAAGAAGPKSSRVASRTRSRRVDNRGHSRSRSQHRRLAGTSRSALCWRSVG